MFAPVCCCAAAIHFVLFYLVIQTQKLAECGERHTLPAGFQYKKNPINSPLSDIIYSAVSQGVLLYSHITLLKTVSPKSNDSS